MGCIPEGHVNENQGDFCLELTVREEGALQDRYDTVLKLSSAEEEKNSKSLRRIPEPLITYSLDFVPGETNAPK